MNRLERILLILLFGVSILMLGMRLKAIENAIERNRPPVYTIIERIAAYGIYT